tara:strand:- start:313 stop:1605 length:1293 start_codon:yes stop_codon:yes gene_type:complete
VIKLFFISFLFLLLNNCSLNDNSKIWKNKENKFETNKNFKKIFVEEKKDISEFNPSLKLNLSINENKTIFNENNFGSQRYNGELNKIANYKFSKFDQINKLDFKPIFLKNGIIFFDKKGSIIRYGNNQKIIWKKNHYTKAEKKLKPKLNFFLDSGNLLVTDSIAKYYSINLETAELNWIRNNIYPFNSEIKKYKDKIFSVDYKNILRCYNIDDGSECWNLKTEDSFTISNIKYSLIIEYDNIIFSNSIGDITAVDIKTGLIKWQLPTQSNSIINETYNFKNSKLVSDKNSLYFSNNKNEFYSIDLQTGTVNWTNKINSNIKPIIIKNFIFTISNEGYLYVVDKNKGNILRVTDLFTNYKDKNRKNIYPVGFVIGNKKIYLSNSDGKLLVVDIETGQTNKIQKISGDLISEPFIFNRNLFVIKNGSIAKYN